jgi:hypothetical protein
MDLKQISRFIVDFLVEAERNLIGIDLFDISHFPL